MADHDDPDRFTRVAETTLGALIHMSHLLADLPIPIVIPDIEDSEVTPAEALLAMYRARDLVEDEPIPTLHQQIYVRAILNWIMAYELLVLARLTGPAPWRLEAAEYALAGLATVLEILDEPLDEEDGS